MCQTRQLSRRRRSPILDILIEAKKTLLAILFGGQRRQRQNLRTISRQRNGRLNPRTSSRQRSVLQQNPRPTSRQRISIQQNVGTTSSQKSFIQQNPGTTSSQNLRPTQSQGPSCRSVPKQKCSTKMQKSCSLKPVRKGSSKRKC